MKFGLGLRLALKTLPKMADSVSVHFFPFVFMLLRHAVERKKTWN